MNVKRFTARTSREALVLVRQALGEDAVVLSTKPASEGVEVLAMAPEGMRQIERMASQSGAEGAAAAARPSLAQRSAARGQPVGEPVEEDVTRLAMSTLSFQDYVRERMLKRRASAQAQEPAQAASAAVPAAAARTLPPMAPPATRAAAPVPNIDLATDIDPPAPPEPERSGVLEQRMADGPLAARTLPQARGAEAALNAPSDESTPREEGAMLHELRQMRDLIEERFGALAYIEKLNRQPAQVRLLHKLLDCGFSPALIKKLGDALPADVPDETAWAAGVLERNLHTGEAEAALEDQGGVYALVGATGVGKTTSTAKIAAAFATKYGAANLGLITLDAYRIGAHEQLRAYGRILGVPVHTAHDRASLEDLLELLAAKKMVLIDTAGMAQRDTRTRELLEMLSHRSVQRLLVVNAASQGETVEDVLIAYGAAGCKGIVLSKMDEAVKLGPALDALIRHRLKIVAVANGQRVPEDWHRLSANALVHRALRGGGGSAYRLDASDVSLVFTAPVHTGTQRMALHG